MLRCTVPTTTRSDGSTPWARTCASSSGDADVQDLTPSLLRSGGTWHAHRVYDNRTLAGLACDYHGRNRRGQLVASVLGHGRRRCASHTHAPVCRKPRV